MEEIDLNSLWDKQYYILKKLYELDADKTPVLAHEFNDLIEKKIEAKEHNALFSLLEKKKFIEYTVNVKAPGFFLLWLTVEGVQEAHRYIQDKERKHLELSNQRAILLLTKIIAVGTLMAAIYYLIESALEIHRHWHSAYRLFVNYFFCQP